MLNIRRQGVLHVDDETFAQFLQHSLRRLDAVELSRYYGPLGPVDGEAGEMCATLAAATAEQRARFSESLNPKQRRLVGRYALRAPMLALRGREPRYLLTGLVAHAILRQRVPDWRDDLVAFAPYYYVAEVLDMHPLSLFEEAAATAVPELASVMRVFGARKDVTLRAFGWRLVERPDGPTFEQLGMSGASSGAVVGEESWDRTTEAQLEKLKRWMQNSAGKDMPRS